MSAMSALFGSTWVALLCVACVIYCLWQLCKLIHSPAKAALIRFARVWLDGQDEGIHQPDPAFRRRASPDPTEFEMLTVQQSVDASLSTPVDLGSGRKLSKKDLMRGLLCSQAVYKDNAAAENLFEQTRQEFPKLDLQFQQVHMSVDHSDWKYKYLVAYADDTIFVAFRGTDSLVDMADNLTITKSPSRQGGKVHEGFLKRSEAFLGPNNKLDVLRQMYPRKRIIVCGHSQGGAVAHMVLLRYFLEGNYKFTQEEPGPVDSLFSIAFGAPHVCDRLAAGIINENEHMRWRFINFVNQSDPVPRLLHHLPSTLMAALKEAPTFFTKSDSVLNQLGGFVGKLISSYATGQTPSFDGEMATQMGGNIVAEFWKKYIDDLSSTVQYKVEKFYKGVQRDDPEFHPVGRYVFLTRRRPVRQTDEWGPWKHNIELGQNREMTELRISEYSNQRLSEALENHTLLSYKTALMETCFLDGRQLGEASELGKAMVASDPKVPVVSTPSPVISSAQLDTSTSPHLLRIKGRNLLFLYERIRVNDDPEGWELNFCEPMTDTQLVLIRRAGQMTRAVFKRVGVVLSTVTLKTAFGSATKHIPVKQEPVKSEETQNMLRALVQVLALKASPPMKRIPSPNVREQLDHILKCATPQDSTGNLKYSLTSLFHAINRADPETNISNHIMNANNMIENVLTFLREGRFESIDTSLAEAYSSSDSATPTSRTWGQSLWSGTKTALLVSGSAAGVGALTFLSGGLAIGSVLAVLPAVEAAIATSTAAAATVQSTWLLGSAAAAGTAGVRSYRQLTADSALSAEKGSLSISDKYLEWLDLAIEEASKWRSGTSPGPPQLDDRACLREPAVSEKKLVEHVEASPEFKRMVEHSYCSDRGSCRNKLRHIIELKSAKFGAASPKLSPKQLLQRINIVMTTHALYKKAAAETFVTVVGAEDAGKSTFITEVMRKFGPPESVVPKTGVSYHTEEVQAYQVTEKIFLVDFPGGNGIGDHADRWRQFSMLPGCAILFLDFKDDLKQEQKQMYKEMKEGLRKTPVVVFNKVDQSFTPERDEEYTKEYFEEKRKKVATQLECYAKDVYYMCVLPNAFQTEERRRMMRERGVLDLETVADKVLGLH